MLLYPRPFISRNHFALRICRTMTVLTVLAVLAVLSGVTACGAGGLWMNGNPAATRHLSPPGHEWTRPDASVLVRDLDWQACGGQRSGNISADRRGATPQEDAELSREKLYAAQRCMLGKEYHYIGSCEGDIPGRYPACQSGSGRLLHD